MNGNLTFDSNLLADAGDGRRGGRSRECDGGAGSSSSPSSGDDVEGRFAGRWSGWGDAERFVGVESDVVDVTSIAGQP